MYADAQPATGSPELEESVDARFDAVEARLTRLEESQQEIAVTLARLVALFEAHFEVSAIASG